MIRNTGVNGVGGATAAPGASGNEGQAHATIAFDTPIDLSSSFNVIRGNSSADTVRLQFSTVVIPEPSTSLLALSGLAALVFQRRRRR